MADRTFLALASDLSDISTAIRAKTGELAKLRFPDGMSGAISGIPKQAAEEHQSYIGSSDKIIAAAGTYVTGIQTVKPLVVKTWPVVFRTPNIINHPDNGEYGEFDFIYLESDQSPVVPKISRILGLRDFTILIVTAYLDVAALKSIGTLSVSNNTISGGIKLLLGSKYTGGSSSVMVRATMDYFE